MKKAIIVFPWLAVRTAMTYALGSTDERFASKDVKNWLLF